MAISLKRQKFYDKLSEPLGSKLRRVLEQSDGDTIVRNIMINDPTKFLSLMATLEPKNVHVKQEHRVNYVSTPIKQILPADLEENIIDVTPIQNC
tara:strand:+ start:369 stop:653 length:285 start_codon:yes stop_codon:yes gene_type:complete